MYLWTLTFEWSANISSSCSQPAGAGLLTDSWEPRRAAAKQLRERLNAPLCVRVTPVPSHRHSVVKGNVWSHANVSHPKVVCLDGRAYTAINASPTQAVCMALAESRGSACATSTGAATFVIKVIFLFHTGTGPKKPKYHWESALFF
ncbi:hypothetical protein ILYODFUR_036502 [Ilyodon furcidens]|uniref:Uncharacterized protein n=1 Tax=Ilyodon furcidens TaxID=33524 RepID=A0ABV0TPU2_9TELE